MVPRATALMKLWWRKASRVWGLDRCTSMTGTLMAFTASWSDTEVWVRAPAFRITARTPRDPAYHRMGINLRLFDPALWTALPRLLIDGARW